MLKSRTFLRNFFTQRSGGKRSSSRNGQLLLSLLASLLLVLSACQQPGSKAEGGIQHAAKGQWHRENSQMLGYFDTVTELIAVLPEGQTIKPWMEQLESHLKSWDELFSAFRESSQKDEINLYRLNERHPEVALKVPDELFERLWQGKKWHEQTKGALNIGLGRLQDRWQEAGEQAAERGEAALPSAEEVKQILQTADLNELILDPDQKTVRYGKADLKLDLGSIAKGWAAEQAAKELQAAGLKHFLLSAGGNIVCRGFRDGEAEPWLVGLREPLSQDSQATRLSLALHDVAAVTSGNYERYFEVNGRRYNHILDAKTGYPAQIHDAVTVVGPDSAVADAYSTALFTLSQAEGERLLEDLGEAYAAVWFDGQKTSYSRHFAQYLKR